MALVLKGIRLGVGKGLNEIVIPVVFKTKFGNTSMDINLNRILIKEAARKMKVAEESVAINLARFYKVSIVFE